MDIPGFYFCLCPDSTLAREHVDGLLKRVNAVGREREIRTFWADEGLDGRFWEALTMQGLTERPRALLVRGAQTLTAEVWKKLSAVLATPRPDILPVFFLESLWEKANPSCPPTSPSCVVSNLRINRAGSGVRPDWTPGLCANTFSSVRRLWSCA